MPFRACDHDGTLRRAECWVRAIQLEARGAAARETEVADHLVVDPGKNPRRPWIVSARLAAIERALEQALRREPDADDLLRRATVASPQAAVGAVERVIVVANLGIPGANAAFGA